MSPVVTDNIQLIQSKDLDPFISFDNQRIKKTGKIWSTTIVKNAHVEEIS